ncbi:hypothetical protein [Cobetia sp. Ld8]|uniref:hypothetical protein n=1 Tax=Cobetia sp. Ld8 TaxID=649154 RepID=UPI0038650BB9
MNTIDNSEAINSIKNFNLKPTTNISFNFFNNQNRKLTKLLNPSSNSVLQGQSKWYHLSLQEPVFISKITILLSGYSNSNKFDIEYSSKNHNIKAARSIKVNDNTVTIAPNAFVTEFCFKPEKRYLEETTIQKIEVHGYTQEGFLEVCQDLSNLEKLKERIISEIEKNTSPAITQANAQIELAQDRINKADYLEEQKSDLENEISNYKQECEDLGLKLNDLEKIVSTKKSYIDELKQEEKNTITRQQELNNIIEQRTSTQRELNTQIASKETELSKLKDNINLFPSELSQFVRQSALTNSRYMWMALLPILIISLITVALFNNAADLTVLYKRPENIDILSILITRMPYVIIAAAIIHSCYKIAKIFISEIIKTNKQGLNLSKISIIATDVSKASSQGLSLTDTEKFHLRTQLKMDLLREHLKDYIQNDYKYSLDTKTQNHSKVKDSKKTELEPENEIEGVNINE